MIIPIISIVFGLLILVLLLSFAIFMKAFYSPKRKPLKEGEYRLARGKIYEPYHEQIKKWTDDMRAAEHQKVSITSFDGLKLKGKYYENKKGAPIEIMFHGYRSTDEHDLCGGVYRCKRLGFNTLIIEQRGSGNSEGHVITFGAKESRDCLSWVNFVINNIDKDAKIIITGISMGAATVMTAASMDLPKNVIGVLADCGYSSTRDIIKVVMRGMKLPADILYPFARLGAIIFGGFDPDKRSPKKSMEKCHIPVIFFHGDEDKYVPCYMSRENYDACASEKKRLVITKGAGHGLCFMVDMDGYFREVEDFFKDII